MPSAAGTRIYENIIPSFMSVYGNTTMMDDTAIHGSQEAKTTNNTVYQQDNIHSHQHRDSNSTQASDSTDSSPTTTISTIDSASLSSDPSPSSSPESPITLVPLSSFSASTFGLDSFSSLKMSDINRPLQLNDERPMTSPGPRKAKNPKALALNLRPSIDTFQTSEPSSPSFIKPPTLKGRKKPSLLSLNTGTAALEPLASPGIPTMLQRRSLKHSVSSPQMLSMVTPGFGPSGGMCFGDRAAPRALGGASRFKESNLGDTFTISEDVDQEAPAGPQMATRGPGMIGGDSFDRPHSGEDAHSPSYPEGPILMHEPHVHLYSEPKLEEAMQFDVIINVAREVKNPFKAMVENEVKEKTQETALNSTSPASDSVEKDPETAASMMSFKTAFESQPAGSETSSTASPSTPRPKIEAKTPEYIHVPWDHNTDVQDELWDLCQTIEARANENKKVLIHCQQGASRSATLIIAYGMYLRQDLGAQEVYAMMQAKSRWVNPNMSLLFSLNDFKKVIERKKAEKNTVVRSKSQKHAHSMSADNLDSPSNVSRARGNSTPSIRACDNPLAKDKDRESEPETPSDALGSFDFGFGERMGDNAAIQRLQPSEDDWESGLMSPRLTEMTRNPIIHAFSREVAPEVSSSSLPDEQPLFSPRIFEFPRTSFFPPPTSTPFSIPIHDPRSPPIQGEAPITRSIDDFL